MEPFAELEAAIENRRSREEIFKAAEQAAQAAIGHRLFTVMAFHADSVEVQRLYSSNEDAYPTGGRKQKRDTAWGRQVLDRGEPFIGTTADDIRAHFNDHEVILGLGLESVLNMPIQQGGNTLGTVNLLHEAGYYTPGHLTATKELAELLGCVLLGNAEND
ncbi:MAG: GAF domain-containing protein [Pseudomonadota bacterium]